VCAACSGEFFKIATENEKMSFAAARNHFRCQHWAAAKNGEKYGVQY
jgi:hypothetical protein